MFEHSTMASFSRLLENLCQSTNGLKEGFLVCSITPTLSNNRGILSEMGAKCYVSRVLFLLMSSRNQDVSQRKNTRWKEGGKNIHIQKLCEIIWEENYGKIRRGSNMLILSVVPGQLCCLRAVCAAGMGEIPEGIRCPLCAWGATLWHLLGTLR